MTHVNETGTHIHTAELLRIRGLTLQKLGRPDSLIEESFTQAVERSRKQSAKTYELRAASELARLWKMQGKTKEGYDLLKGIYDWFTEGFDSIDLREAKALLSEWDIDGLVE